MQSLPALLPGHYYHIYNRGNNRENLFREEKNYAYFLRLYGRHVEPVAQTFAYCLMPNHFHLLVRIKMPEEQPASSQKDPTRAFANLFNAYAKAFNRMYGRTGALFEHRFGRIEVDAERYFMQLVRYIHRNPEHHGFVDDFRMYAHSSWQALGSHRPTRLARETVLTWFGGASNFQAAHHTEPDTGALTTKLDLHFEAAVSTYPT